VVEAPAGPDWERINDGRHKLFEGPRKPELTEAQKALAKSVRNSPACSNGCERQS